MRRILGKTETGDVLTVYLGKYGPVIQIGDGQLFQLCIFTCFCSILIKNCTIYNLSIQTIITIMDYKRTFRIKTLVFLFCELKCNDKIITSASGVWKILAKR